MNFRYINLSFIGPYWGLMPAMTTIIMTKNSVVLEKDGQSYTTEVVYVYHLSLYCIVVMNTLLAGIN